MKMSLASCFMFCMLTMLSLPAYAQSAKEAVMALKKLEAKVEAGVSYPEYGKALGEAKFSVNVYVEGPEAKKNPELAGSIKTAMARYELAGSVFQTSLRTPSMYLDYSRRSRVSSEFQKARLQQQKAYKNIVDQYPEANRFVEDGGAIARDASDEGKGINDLKYGRILRLRNLLPIILQRASEDLKNASTLLSKETENVEEDDRKLEIIELKMAIDYLKQEIAKLRMEIDGLKMEMKELKKQ